MRFIGVDLAWGETAWTGLAALDERGRLLDMGRVRSDDEIERWVAPHMAGPVVVGIDAPLVVPNLQGRRPCESQVSRVFGRFHAGAHSSNLSLPSFRSGPRGGRIAGRLGLAIDPAIEPRTDVRRAWEVYPHPATVTLFGLDRVLPYKAKPGRTPDSRRAAFLRLLDYTEALSESQPGLSVAGHADWGLARTAVESASTHRELNAWEDILDAVLCAYVAMHRWWHGVASRTRARSATLRKGEMYLVLVEHVQADGSGDVSLCLWRLRSTTCSLPSECRRRDGGPVHRGGGRESARRPGKGSEVRVDQPCGWLMLTIQATPNRSTHMPNSSPHICFSRGTDTVPPSDSFSQ